MKAFFPSMEDSKFSIVNSVDRAKANTKTKERITFIVSKSGRQIKRGKARISTRVKSNQVPEEQNIICN